MDITTKHERSFRMLFADSINLLEFAEDPEFESLAPTFCRSSILCSMLLPEVAANTCLETLNLERSVFQDIDKLSVLAKFDFFVRTSYRNRRIDRGITAVQGIQEIKGLRDRYVHPKRKPVDWQRLAVNEDDGTETHVEIQKYTSLLEIPQNPGSWNNEHACKVMKAVHHFLKYIFKDLCRLSTTRTTAILFSEELTPDKTQPIFPFFDREVKTLLKDWAVDTSYLKILWY